jgi:dihydrodiol dehydrogenase / D-xylose 1-dehydrogenase (NADP)
VTDIARTRWAILGPGAISRDFVAGLRASSHGVLHAVGSSDAGRAAAFAAEAGADVSGTYDEVLARDDVDAVYVGTVHVTHAELAVRALEAGKAVLCEKPAAPTADGVDEILGTAERTGRPFVEAFKNRFGPWADALRALLADESLGRPQRVEAAFGFDAPTRTGRLFDPALAGGAILDVGCYAVSLAVEAAFARGAVDPAAIGLVSASGEVHNGVDADASARVRVGEVDATLQTSVIRDLPSAARIVTEHGAIELPDAWGERDLSSSRIVVRRDGADTEVRDLPTIQPMGAEADAVSRALAEGRQEAPEMPWSHSRAIAGILTAWRADVLRDVDV